jgi:hypothetical protein
MLSRQVFGAGEIIAIPLPNIGSMGGEYSRSEGATAENAVSFPGAARRLLNLLSTDGGDTGVHEGNLSIKQDKKCGEPAAGPRACSATRRRFE